MRGSALVLVLVTNIVLGESDDGDYFPSPEPASEPRSKHIWRQGAEFDDTALDEATLLLSGSKDIIENNPLDNLSDLRDIHQFSIDLSNYTDHEAIESEHPEVNHEAVHHEFNDHFDILPDMDTRDFNDTEIYPDEASNDLHDLNPDLYEVVTSTPEDNEANKYDEHELNDHHFDPIGSSQDGMDSKYYTLLENIHKKIHQKMNNTDNSVEEVEEEIHQEENDVMHPLISLRAVRPNSMRLSITPNPKKYDENAMVRLMYKRVPMNKPAHIRNLDDPIVEYIHLYRPDQEHFLINLPRGKYIVCADYTMTEAHSGKKVVLQHDCFETTVDRLDDNSLQGGVVGIIALAILCMVCCMGYAIYHRCIREKVNTDEEMIRSSK